MFKINLAPQFAAVVSDMQKAETVAAKAATYMHAVEQIGKNGALTSTQKLLAVKTALINDIGAFDPVLAASLLQNWSKVAGIINGAVALYNSIKWDFQVVAPIIEALAPSTIGAISAIEGGAAVAEKVLAPVAQDAAESAS